MLSALVSGAEVADNVNTNMIEKRVMHRRWFIHRQAKAVKIGETLEESFNVS